MNSSQLPFAELREQAIALRRAGRSRREIKEILGVTSNKALTKMVAGEPPAAWTLRPNAKDDLRAEARQLRAQGLTYKQIAANLGISKSSISLWVRDLRRPGLQSAEELRRRGYEEWRKQGGYAEGRKRAAAAQRAYWEVQRPINEAHREATRAAAAAQIGTLTDREILIAGAIAYWCEGAKNKPYRRFDHVCFVNSDPSLVEFFLRFLDIAGITREDVIYRIQIHENADVALAQQFWLGVTGASDEQFRRPTLKRHNPKTVRTNVGADYHGCLRVDVRRSSVLYRRIEGWARAAMAAQPALAEPLAAGSPEPAE
jgi:transcriptional regulator with XRE-family HTH domain